MSDIRISAKLFAAAHCFVGKDFTRYYLKGVKIERASKGILLVATDGHVLGALHDPDGFVTKKHKKKEDIIISLSKDGIRACKILRDESARTIHITLNPFRVDIIATPKVEGDDYPVFTDYFADKIDATYPDWKRVAPAHTVENPVIFDSGKIDQFMRAAKLLGKTPNPISITPDGAMDPAHVLFAGISNFYGVIMPMRSEISECPPEWIKK